jgi:predicted Zn finger-like uncharacterized protein
MPALFTCPSCSAKLKLSSPPPAGKKIKCPKCGTAFAPPGEPAPADPKVAPDKPKPATSAERPPDIQPEPTKGKPAPTETPAKSRTAPQPDDEALRKPNLKDAAPQRDDDDDDERPRRRDLRDQDDEDDDDRPRRRDKPAEKGSGSKATLFVLLGVFLGCTGLCGAGGYWIYTKIKAGVEKVDEFVQEAKKDLEKEQEKPKEIELSAIQADINRACKGVKLVKYDLVNDVVALTIEAPEGATVRDTLGKKMEIFWGDRCALVIGRGEDGFTDARKGLSSPGWQIYVNSKDTIFTESTIQKLRIHAVRQIGNVDYYIKNETRVIEKNLKFRDLNTTKDDCLLMLKCIQTLGPKVQGTEVPPKEPQDAPPAFTLTTEQLGNAFKADKEAAKKKYDKQILAVEGVVYGAAYSDPDGHPRLDLDCSVPDTTLLMACHMAPASRPKVRGLTEGQKVKVKGLCYTQQAPPHLYLMECQILEAGPNPAIEISAVDLAKEFAADKEAAGKKYTEKQLVVEGVVVEVLPKTDKEPYPQLILEGANNKEGKPIRIRAGPHIEHHQEFSNTKKGDKVKIKGKCNDLEPNNQITIAPSIIVK